MHASPYTRDEIIKVAHVTKMIKRLTGGFLEVIEFPDDGNGFLQQQFIHSSVHFIHRTARDFFLQDTTRQKDLENSWPGFQENQPYDRMFLAEFVFGIKSKITKPNRLGPYLWAAAFRWGIGVNTFRTLNVFMSRHFLPGSMSTQPSIENDFLGGDSQRSFVHLAAYWGLSEFVLSEHAADSSLKRTFNDSNLLMAVLCGITSIFLDFQDTLYWKLALNLLNNGMKLDELCLVRPRGVSHYEVRWPLWIIASLVAADYLISSSYNTSKMPFLRRLYHYTVSEGKTYSVSIQSTAKAQFRIDDIEFGDLFEFLSNVYENRPKGHRRLQEPRDPALPLGTSTAGALYDAMTMFYLGIIDNNWESSYMNFSKAKFRAY